jgi:hypothetical protein
MDPTDPDPQQLKAMVLTDMGHFIQIFVQIYTVEIVTWLRQLNEASRRSWRRPCAPPDPYHRAPSARWAPASSRSSAPSHARWTP